MKLKNFLKTRFFGFEIKKAILTIFGFKNFPLKVSFVHLKFILQISKSRTLFPIKLNSKQKDGLHFLNMALAKLQIDVCSIVKFYKKSHK